MKKLTAAVVLPALALSGAALYLSLRGLQSSTPLPLEPTTAQARYELLNTEWTRSNEQGLPEFKAQAVAITWFDDDSAQLQQVSVERLGGESSPWQLQAPEGHMPANSRDLSLSGPVQAKGRWPDGADLNFETEQLWVETATKRLRTDKPVALQGPGRRLEAKGLSADFSGRELALLDEVRARYVPHD